MGGIPSKPDPSKHLEIIGAGYSRTGTASMQYALQKLLDGPVLHGATHLLSREDAFSRKWVEILKAREEGDKERELKVMRDVFGGYVACTDSPTLMLLPELLELYPNAKVVLVTRNRTTWYKSFEPVLANASAWFLPYLTAISPGLRWFPTIMQFWKADTDALLARYGRSGDYEHLIEVHNQWVMETVPKDKLLVMSLDEGWEPLCKFLGKPIPGEPFPRTNDAEAADRIAKWVFLKLLLRWIGLFSVIGGGYKLGMQVLKHR
ncbi:P-loop containing nucleoside triphosphate hydrolase protein [Xylariales sp. PMI_506]|nr:P-loop containing nucleoside triphosphate hydrolase protein [Xylariales sp. PMI_506]